MKEYRVRLYRDRFNKGRWKIFTVGYKESDLCIGVDAASYSPSMDAYVARLLKGLRSRMDSYLAHDPKFAFALSPYAPLPDAPEIFHRMYAASARAGVGPMAAVAGAVAEYIGQRIGEEYGCREVIVENGGDIYADISEGMEIPVFAGASPLSEKVGIFIPEGGRMGICTSSGTVGPSLSLGNADAVMVVCADAALADSYATAFANRIRSRDDIPTVIGQLKTVTDITGAICIKDDMFGICGEYGLKIWKGAKGK